jgi:hypothetical protein
MSAAALGEYWSVPPPNVTGPLPRFVGTEATDTVPELMIVPPV